MSTAIVDEARARAEDVLLGNGGPIGILAARRSYQQVWARDSMVCGFGLMVAQREGCAELHRRSLTTLAHYQSPRGKIPHNVGFAGVADPALVAEGGALPGAPGKAIVDTAHAGCIDSNMWFVLGHYVRHLVARDTDQLRAAWPSLEAAYTWLAYQDSNECGLLEAHEAKDWADLFANRYNTLFANVLWYAANRALAHIARWLGREADVERYATAAVDIRFKLNMLLWVGPEVRRDYDWIGEHRAEWAYPLHRIDAELVQRPYYLPYVAFRDFADRFDTFGNVLAILFGVAEPAQTDKIFDFIRATGLADPWPIRVLHPVIHPGDKDWREYYRVRNLNQPDQYHNGGAWPFIGGFYVAALVRAGRIAAARVALERLAEMNRHSRDGDGSWEFNEWFHGTSHQPAGFPLQSWSAAMYVFAHECVQRERVPFFDPGLERDGGAGW